MASGFITPEDQDRLLKKYEEEARNTPEHRRMKELHLNREADRLAKFSAMRAASEEARQNFREQTGQGTKITAAEIGDPIRATDAKADMDRARAGLTSSLGNVFTGGARQYMAAQALQARAAGQAPSVAQMQGGVQGDNLLRQAAGSMSGGGLLGLNAAMGGQAQAGVGIAAGVGSQRSQELAQARDAASQALAQARGGDIQGMDIAMRNQLEAQRHLAQRAVTDANLAQRDALTKQRMDDAAKLRASRFLGFTGNMERAQQEQVRQQQGNFIAGVGEAGTALATTAIDSLMDDDKKKGGK